MKTSLKKILRTVFTFMAIILSACKDSIINVDNPEDYFDDYLLYATFEGDADTIASRA